MKLKLLLVVIDRLALHEIKIDIEFLSLLSLKCHDSKYINFCEFFLVRNVKFHCNHYNDSFFLKYQLSRILK